MDEKFKIVMRSNVTLNIRHRWQYNFLIQFDDMAIGKKLVEYEEKCKKEKNKPIVENYPIYLTRFYYSDDDEQPEFKTDYKFEIELIVIESSPLLKDDIEKALIKIIDEQPNSRSDK